MIRTQKSHSLLLAMAALMALIIACNQSSPATETPLPATPTNSPTVALTNTATAEITTPTASETAAASNTPGDTAAASNTPGDTGTATNMPNLTATLTFTLSPTGTAQAIVTGGPGSISGIVWHDKNKNGKRDSGDDEFPNIRITLGSGACPSYGLATDITGGDGRYFFARLATPGTYCVNALPASAAEVITTLFPVTVNMGPGDNKVVNFGIWG